MIGGCSRTFGSKERHQMCGFKLASSVSDNGRRNTKAKNPTRKEGFSKSISMVEKVQPGRCEPGIRSGIGEGR